MTMNLTMGLATCLADSAAGGLSKRRGSVPMGVYWLIVLLVLLVLIVILFFPMASDLIKKLVENPP